MEPVAVIHRHLPLSTHDGAYRGARMAECAADQGRFEAMHQVLFRTEDLMEADASKVADADGVPDLVGFVEGALLDPPPDSVRLTNLVRSTLLGREVPPMTSRILPGDGGKR